MNKYAKIMILGLFSYVPQLWSMELDQKSVRQTLVNETDAFVIERNRTNDEGENSIKRTVTETTVKNNHHTSKTVPGRSNGTQLLDGNTITRTNPEPDKMDQQINSLSNPQEANNPTPSPYSSWFSKKTLYGSMIGLGACFTLFDCLNIYKNGYEHSYIKQSSNTAWNLAKNLWTVQHPKKAFHTLFATCAIFNGWRWYKDYSNNKRINSDYQIMFEQNKQLIEVLNEIKKQSNELSENFVTKNEYQKAFDQIQQQFKALTVCKKKQYKDYWKWQPLSDSWTIQIDESKINNNALQDSSSENSSNNKGKDRL